MSSIRLRPWQRAALDKFKAGDQPDFMAVATPGAGKTTFALAAARHVLAEHKCRLIVVAPTAHLKWQWAEAAERFGLRLDAEWSSQQGGVAKDMHGIVTTYQQVTGSADALRAVAVGSFVLFDEIHHAGDDKAWGSAVLHAFEPARQRLSLSGTPFRSDSAAIPFVNYHLDEALADYEYGYGEALGEGGVVRPVYFPRIDGDMEWTSSDGTVNSASFADDLDRSRGSERLRAALSNEGEWLPTVLREANKRLVAIRQDHPEAGGLVIATDQEHARAIAGILRDRIGTVAEVVTSDDPTASMKITRFAGNKNPWLVAVRMVSEGVDIPRLRVGVFATTTSTELFFRQAVGRLVRWTAGRKSQKAYFFIPDDPRLRHHAFQIAQQRRHALKRAEEEEPRIDELDVKPDGIIDEDADKQDGFQVISAVATEVTVHAASPTLFDDEPDPREPDEYYLLDDDFVLDLDPLPLPGGGYGGAGAGGGYGPDGTLTHRQERDRLRDLNADIAKSLVARTGMTHPKVNAEMNRMAGIEKVSTATLDQLERRLRYAESWLRKARR
jgi:superfamily II DNA or RNA helicase